MGSKVVLLPITVPEGDLCICPDGAHYICEHFDNTGGHAHCDLGFWNYMDKNTYEYYKAIECAKLKEE